ncbi:MASE4 domain-containing protein [Variovorax sp. GT1P44]|uniref:MASE4 domain-containing protein n=1 Tax=Variovorax sp. GT1P44 TaxID=3443742 RepID=UPI003F445888
MLKDRSRSSDEQPLVLSNLSPGPAQKKLALALVVGFLIVFALITFGPLKAVQLRRVDAFIPAYLTAMFVSELIAAILLYAQFSILRSPAILAIGSGYLFTALVLIPFVLVYPGVFVPGRGLFGGPQSTSWVWFFWHIGFPLFTVAYALLKRDAIPSEGFWGRAAREQIFLSASLTAAAIYAVALLCLEGEALLPQVALPDSLRFTSLWPILIGVPVALANVWALILLWRRRHSVLDLWLIVVTCLHVFEASLAYYPNPVRFSVGSYAVRIIGFLASGLVLTVLLYETTALYGAILDAFLRQRREREARRMTGDMVAAAIAHEVKQPMTAMVMTAGAGLRLLDRAPPNLHRAKEAFELVVRDGHRVAAMIDSIRANFRSQTTASLDVNELVQRALALEREDLQKHRILVRTESNTKIPRVQGNRIELQQVLLNLIANAVAAMAAKQDAPRILSVDSEEHEGAGVVISVADTGTGISAQDIDRIFHPRFTTKADGMGMGLPICLAIVEAHNGRLWVTPNTPRGTVFQFTLPVVQPIAI